VIDLPDGDAFRLALGRAIESVLSSGIVVIDTQGRQVYVNDAFCRLVGWPREDLLGRLPPFQYWPPDAVAEIRARFDDALSGRFPPGGARLEFMRRDGTRFPALVQVAVLRSGDRIEGWLASVADATVVEAASLESQALARRLRELTQHLEDVLYVNDVGQGRLVYVSPSFERVWGLPVAVVTADPHRYLEAIEPAWREQAQAAFGRQMAGERTDLEYPLRRPDGTRIWVRDQSFPVVEDGKVCRIVGIASDITQMKATEARLQRSLAQLAVAESVARLGHCDVDLVLGTMSWSAGLYALLELPPGSAPGYRAALRRVHPADRRRLRPLHRALRRGSAPAGHAVVGELAFRLCLPSGERHVRERAHRSTDGWDRPLRAMLVLQDVTEQERMAAELDAYRHRLEERVASRTAELAAARQRAEAASRAKSDFLANVSHEIRTPMNAIVGLVHMMLEDESDPRRAERLQGIDMGAQQLMAVVSDVLDLSKIEAGRLELEATVFDLRQTLRRACDMVRPNALAKGLVFEARLADDLPAWVRGDAVRLAQVLLNLLSNAVKFTARGAVRLDARLEPAPDGAGRLRVEVTDTGIGVSDDLLPRLFRPFEQADGSTTRRHGGTGLGLAISRRLVELMRGSIGTRRVEPQGSCFWFEVPLECAEAPAAAPAAGMPVYRTPVPGGAAARLLVVDDNALNRRVAAELLRRRGHEVDEAPGGAEAVAMAAAWPYALVLMDLQMPGVDGLAAALAIRALPGHRDTPIVAMTGNVLEEDRERCREAGMVSFVAKPVRPASLLAEVARWVPADAAGSAQAATGAGAAVAPGRAP